jgi:hypothetical protein
MTEKEKNEAISIVNKYRSINEKIERMLNSIEKINHKKDLAMNELEQLKKRELEFVRSYKEKYGESSNLFLDLQRMNQ